jgi:hypothetical protein
MRLDHKPHFVYLVGNKELNHYKIGYSINPRHRLGAIQVPFEIKLLAAVPCENRFIALATEQILHSRFGKHRTRGEWFKNTPLGKFVDESETAIAEAKKITGFA